LLLLSGVPTAFATPVIQHWQTAQGTRVFFVEAHELPMVDVQVVFDAGSGRDHDKPGLALLTNGLLSEGAAGRNADQISQSFENIGAVYGSSASMDSASVSLRVMTDAEKLDAASSALADLLAKPDFPRDAFERERNRTLVAIQQKQQSPSDLASDAFFAAVYGEHPYARPQEGTEAMLKAITLADIRNFHRQYYVAGNAMVALVGNLDRAQAEALVNKLLGGLETGMAATPLPEVTPLAAPATVRINHPSTQTHILAGQPGIMRTDPDLFPVYVGNEVLGGGGMVSRLFEEIREKRGLSYSVYSYFIPMRQAGPFIAGLQTRSDQAEEALRLLHEELEKFIEKGPSEAELKAAKKNLTGGFPLRIDSNRDIINYLSMIGFYNLPLDYLDTYNRKIMAVTAEQIRDAFRRKLSPDRFVTVMVGPAPVTKPE
jgi:zinc protease